MHIFKEIRRDPFVAKTFKTQYFDPKPPMPKKKRFEDGASMNQAIGHEAVDLLLWFI